MQPIRMYCYRNYEVTQLPIGNIAIKYKIMALTIERLVFHELNSQYQSLRILEVILSRCGYAACRNWFSGNGSYSIESIYVVSERKLKCLLCSCSIIICILYPPSFNYFQNININQYTKI